MQKRGILTKMANCVERKLVELFSDDLSDSEVRESKVKAEVTHKSSNTEVKVSDGNTTATILFAPDANKRFANMAEVGASFAMIVVGVWIIVDGSVSLAVTIENQINVRWPHDSAFQAQGRSLVHPLEDRSLGFAGRVVHEGINLIAHST